MPFCDGDVVVDDHDHHHDDGAAADDGDGVDDVMVFLLLVPSVMIVRIRKPFFLRLGVSTEKSSNGKTPNSLQICSANLRCFPPSTFPVILRAWILNAFLMRITRVLITSYYMEVSS